MFFIPTARSKAMLQVSSFGLVSISKAYLRGVLFFYCSLFVSPFICVTLIVLLLYPLLVSRAYACMYNIVLLLNYVFVFVCINMLM